MEPAQQPFDEADEDDVVIFVDEVGYTKRELALECASARRHNRMADPECDHDHVSPRDGLCLNCGNFVRDN